MGTRMSRTPGGGSSTKQCVFGKEGDRGMGSNYSGKKLGGAWNPTKSKSRMGKPRPWAKMPDHYEAISHNPSGASNTALKKDSNDT